MTKQPPVPPRYTAEVHHVREVTLFASTRGDAWTKTLGREKLRPFLRADRSEVIVSACGSRYMGLPFRELTIGVAVSEARDGATHDGYYLFAGFTSRRFFAFVERRVFHTPYRHGEVLVNPVPPASVTLLLGERPVFAASMSEAVFAKDQGEMGWEGTIYLPSRREGRVGQRFFAKLHGPTRGRAYAPQSDSFELRPEASGDIFDRLLAADMRGRAWEVRTGAVHARSKTYDRA